MPGRNYQIFFTEGATEYIRELFGCAVAGPQLAAAAGALDGAQVLFTLRRPGELLVEIRHPYILEQRRSFRRDRDGKLFVYNEEFTKQANAPPALGANALWRQVTAARKLSCQYIETYAAGDPRSAARHGYYVWAVLGFDASLTLREQRSLWPPLVGSQTLNEVMLRGGEEWWRIFGGERKMIFDLRANSKSEQILLAYMQRKGILP